VIRRAVLACSVAGLLLAGCGGDENPGTVGLYDRAPVPPVPDRTAAIDPVLTTASADGQYWSDLTGRGDGEQRSLTFDLSQALFADTCVEELGADECANDYGVIAEPHKVVDVVLTDIQSVTVASEKQQNYAITAGELWELAGGAPPADAAPEGYTFVEFPFLLTVSGGKVVEAHQIWVP
jgi:hypothetical protein